MAKEIEAIVVVATAVGYYGNQLRQPGDRFGIAADDDFSDVWMTRQDAPATDDKPAKPAKMTAAERIAMAESLTGRADIKTAKEADEIIASLEAETSGE